MVDGCLSLAVAPLSLLLLRPSPLYSSLLLLSSYTTNSPYKNSPYKKSPFSFQNIFLICDHQIHSSCLRRPLPRPPARPPRSASSAARRTPTRPSVVREENPGISFGQVGKQLGDKWKALSETDRKPYDAKAAADKKRYEEEKAAYLAKAEEEEEEESS
ncbi:transcriptional regulator family: HMG [Penicillium roqueforti]|uniref:transcriptional regulator family: HMG n=1 Tax=Penicillium roqueforti TaxID=5082 RepID=UPI00190C0396|nr:transcriptional regulator family: HMG [Penicillium roqueforti]KAF9243001.1 transcriptional regulator family: HMG [Penicillium roqueforti]KAI2728531.1 transcriptional regulator family: HMG [Penicillium roqueforti]KAI2732631.1 transcriptional regulator family: HMG [Penicillium roqueforti]KAI3101508.1 transcriptional regulator family: HMG [Penicillium roqueforti]KAI3111260.1 transcriptional regulator family: HMG [Penicillium roqueforti]